MNIWLPHVPKSGGISLYESLSKEYPYYDEENVFKYENSHNRVWPKRIITNNNNIIITRHGNPLTNEMKDWIKILVLRHPLERIVSTYNHDILEGKAPNNLPFDKWIDWGTFFHWSYLDFLNTIQKNCTDSLINNFNKNNIFEIFDFIIELKDIKKVHEIIENNFSKKVVNWKLINTSQHRSNNIKPLTVKDLTDKQINNIYSKKFIVKDIEFYELWKVNNQQSK